MQRNGFIAQGVEPLADAATAACREVTGSAPPPVSEDITSMWRDTNVYNEFGIPALTFGPTGTRWSATSTRRPAGTRPSTGI